LMNSEEIELELNRQVNNLIDDGYANRVSQEKLREKVKDWSEKLVLGTLPKVDVEKGRLPFVVVINERKKPITEQIKLLKWQEKVGIEKLDPLKPGDFKTVDEVQIPDEDFYLLVDVDRGKANINLPPKVALRMIQKAGRSPLTMAEGIALIMHFPEFLKKNYCFSLLASRHEGDQRVPAIWISQKQAKLGWCWNGNPHTWLGSASCKSRLN